MIFKFTHDDVLHVYAETVTEVRQEWGRLYDSGTPCLLWLKGTPMPWAGFPMTRLLK